MAVRKVSNRGGNIIGFYPSLKMGRMVAFESTIERDLVYLLDYERQVEEFCEQPCKIEYLHDGKKRTYTPDYSVRFIGGHEVIVECKPAELTGKEENRRKFEAGRNWAANEGVSYEVVTDEMLRQGCRLQNIKFLSQFARHELPVAVKQQIFKLLQSSPRPLSIQEILYDHKLFDLFRGSGALIFCALYYQELVTNLDDELINMNSRITLPMQVNQE